MKENENSADLSQALEQQLSAYFSLYEAETAFKANIEKQLVLHASQHLAVGSVKSKKRLLPDVFYQPRLKWVGGILFFIIVLLSLFAIHPVRAIIERSLDIGYIEGAGFVKVSETDILNGPTYSAKPDQTIGIDQVVADPKKTQIWFHSTGTKFNPEDTNGEFLAYLDVNGHKLPLVSYGWNSIKQEGIFGFGSLGMTMPMSFILHISPDWSIPIRLIPMGQISAGQSMTLYPDICQTHRDVELCLRAFVSDSTGYHLWLSGSSGNPIFYLQALETRNPLTGEEAILMDSSGHQLNQVYPSQLPMPIEVAPVVSDVPKEVSTTLSFERSTNDNDSLDFLVAGLTGKTPADELIMCEPGKNPGIGDQFPCEKTMNIAGELVRFHTGEITQEKYHGIILTLRSDPIQSSNGLLLTGVDLENINDYSSFTIGTGFDVRTKQLELWFTVDPANPETLYGIRIIDAYLTILEPFQLSWSLNP